MKRLFTFLLMFVLFGLFTANAQRMALDNIQRNLVLVEIGTGTWCTYCPGAAMGADDLIENGHPVAIVENHYGDAYANNYSNTRNSFYNITNYPTAVFDGTLSYVGGSHTASMYNNYVPLVNQRMAVTTPFDLDVTFTDNGGNNFTASVDVSKVGDYSSDVVLHCFITESEIMVAWQGQDHLNFVNRLMVPGTGGTPLDFSNGNNLVEELNFDMNSSWERDNCEIVVAIQNMSTKEVLNCAKISMLQATYDYDATITEVLYPLEQACGTEISPRIEIKNYGGVNLTSVDVNYSVNGGDVSVYTWEGNLAFTETDEVSLPAIPFTMEANNTIEFTLTNPNGVEDENPANNTATADFTEAPETSTNIEMQLFVGAWGNEISWEFYNGNGEVIAEGSGYDNNEIINMVLPVDGTGCYDFYLYDSGGNGFAGGGYLKLYDDGLVFAYITTELTNMLDVPFHAMNALAGPSDFTANADGYDISFEWTAPSKAVLQGYNIFEASDMVNPINSNLITGTTFGYTVGGNGYYEYYLQAVYDEGNSDLIGPVFADINVGISELTNGDFRVYPNPMNQMAQMTFDLKENAMVSWSIYNLTGAKVVDSPAQNMSAGQHKVQINTLNLEDGIYFINLEINGESTTKKVTVLK